MMNLDMKPDRADRPIHVSELIASPELISWLKEIAEIRSPNLQLRVTPEVLGGLIAKVEIDLRDPLGGSHAGGENAMFSVNRTDKTVMLLHSSAIEGLKNLRTPSTPPAPLWSKIDSALKQLDERVTAIAVARANRSPS